EGDGCRGEHERDAGRVQEARVGGEKCVVIEPGEPRDAEDRNAVLERQPDDPEGRVEGDAAEDRECGREEKQARPSIGALTPGHRTAGSRCSISCRAAATASCGVLMPT